MSESGDQKRRRVRITNCGKYSVNLGPLRRSLPRGSTVEFVNLPRDWITLRIQELMDRGIIQVEELDLTDQEIQELRDAEKREEARIAAAQEERKKAAERLRARREAAATARKLEPPAKRSARSKEKPKPVEPAPRVFLPDECDSTEGGSDGEPEQD